MVSERKHEIANFEVSHGEDKISFAKNPFGPGDYEAIGRNIMGLGLKVPVGDDTSSLLYSIYCGNPAKHQKVRDFLTMVKPIVWDSHLMRCPSRLWVFNQNLWTPKGVYVILDLQAIGVDAKLNVSDIERMVNETGIKEYGGVRFSRDEKVRFAPVETYKLGEHSPESLSTDGWVVANFNVDGAKKLGEVSSKLKDKPIIYGLDSDSFNEGSEDYKTVCWRPIRMLNLSLGKRLQFNGNLWYNDDIGSYAFGKL